MNKSNTKAKEVLSTIVSYVAVIAVLIILVAGTVLQISNRSLAKSIAKEREESLSLLNQLVESDCRVIPEGTLNALGKTNKDEAIEYCQAQLAGGGAQELRSMVIDGAIRDYFDALKSKHSVYTWSNTVACVILYCPVDDIKDLERFDG